MPVKLRLQRHGKKGFAFFHIVVADARAPRDGNFIEKIGAYNPNTNPATIELDFDKTLAWLHNGAQPTETVRAMLSYKGILYKKHLDDGVKKGALTQEAAEAKFAEWQTKKVGKIDEKKNRLQTSHTKSTEERLDAERKVNEARAAANLKKMQAAQHVAEAPAAEAPAEAEAPAQEG